MAIRIGARKNYFTCCGEATDVTVLTGGALSESSTMKSPEGLDSSVQHFQGRRS